MPPSAVDSPGRFQRVDEVSLSPVAARWLVGDVRSWPDWLLDRVSAAPGPTWLVYGLAFAALALLGHGARWLGNAKAPGNLDPAAVLEASYPVVFLATMGGLNAVALR